MIVSMPARFPSGQVCRHPVHGVDLVRTFFAVAGIPVPWEMHGRDLSALLADPGNPAHAVPCLYEHTGYAYGSDVTRTLTEEPESAVHNQVPWYVAVRDGSWKYIRYLAEGETEELYELGSDPEELANLAEDPGRRGELERLRGVLAAELRRTGAGFADRLPASRQMAAGR
jgi:arylsulfatase A-like enzyme